MNEEIENLPVGIHHAAGKFYRAVREDGRLFFGTLEKAESFMEGFHIPMYQPVSTEAE